MVWEELDESLVMPSVAATSQDDALAHVGSALIDAGYAKPSYVDALIEREANFPTGLDIDGVGIAIPHTEVSHVLKEGTAIARLDEPVRFIQMGTDDEPVDVRLVFMLAVQDPQAHLAILQRIVAIIQDKSVLETLLTCNNSHDIIETIRAKEESL